MSRDAKHSTFKWTRGDPVAVAAARVLLTDARAIKSGVRTAVDWDGMVWSDDGVVVHWLRPASTRAAIVWFQRKLERLVVASASSQNSAVDVSGLEPSVAQALQGGGDDIS
jgi:hypothetical protein